MPLMPADLRALVVDDHTISRATLGEFLCHAGITMNDEAGSIAEASASLAGNPYDIVFLDLNLQDGSGLDLLRACRANHEYDGVAIVIVSSESADKCIIDALREGATSYIVKPISADSFAQHLNKVLKWLSLKRRDQDVQEDGPREMIS